MLDQLVQSVTAKDIGVLVVAAVTTYFIARDAQRTARAANRRIDGLVREIKDRGGYAERITRLEGDEMRTQKATAKARSTGHRAVNIGAALFGYLDGAFDVLEETTGKKIPRPKLRDLLKEPNDEGSHDDEEGPGA